MILRHCLRQLGLLALVWCLGLAMAAWAQEAPDAVTSIADLLARPVDGKYRNAVPVRVRGVCTYPNSKGIHFYMHDGKGGILVALSDPSLCPAFGDEVEVTGPASGSGGDAVIVGQTVRVIGRGRPMPAPAPVSPADPQLPEKFSQWVEVEGVVLQYRFNSAKALQLHIAGENTWGVIYWAAQPEGARDWPLHGARIRARGVQTGKSSLEIFAAGADQLTVLEPGREDPMAAPKVMVSELRGGKPRAARVKITGTVLEVRDQRIYLRDATGAVWADHLYPYASRDRQWEAPPNPVPIPSLQAGDEVEAVGSPMVTSPHVTLRYAQFRVVRRGEAPAPRAAQLEEAANGTAASDLVTVRGRMKSYSSATLPGGQNRWRETLKLEQDGAELEVVLEDPGAKGQFAGFKVDDLVEATGIVRPEEGTPAYRLCVRASQDVHSLGIDPALTKKRQLQILAIGVGGMAAALLWVVLLRRKVAARVADLGEANRRLEKEVEERKRAQAELDRALVAEREVGELKTRFVSLVSHEFRTPLGITMSAVELLRNYLDRLPPEKLQELLDDIHRATLRMSAMMEQVLLLGRVEAGRLTFQTLPLDLAELGGKLVDESLSATNRKDGIEFQAENDLAGAKGDEVLIRHIFSNLLSNAVKYSPGQKGVEFRVRREGESALFVVRDRGIGIPAADQARLFEAFHRATNVGETPGTGLGLLIVKRCVELHHGTISFDSQEGQGTTFYVRLPLFGVGEK